MILHRPEVCKGNAFPGISPHGNSLKSWVKFDQPHIPSLSLSLQVHPHHYCHCHDKPFLKCDWLHSMQIKHQLELPSHWLMGMWHRIWSHYQSIFFAHFEITPFLYQHKLCNRVEYQFLPVLVISMEIYFSYKDQLTNHYYSRKYIFRQYACTSNHCKIVIWFSFKIGKYCFVKFIFEKVNILTVHI